VDGLQRGKIKNSTTDWKTTKEKIKEPMLIKKL